MKHETTVCTYGTGNAGMKPEKQIDRTEYERDLKRRQSEHLRKIQERADASWRPCLHDGCPQCHGTGIKSDGTPCIHMISCPCPKCTPR